MAFFSNECVCGCILALVIPACKPQLFCAPLHCRVWSVSFYHIFLHYLLNGTIFEKKIFTELKMGFDFLYKFWMKHFLS
jgi:hypothetical protein